MTGVKLSTAPGTQEMFSKLKLVCTESNPRGVIGSESANRVYLLATCKEKKMVPGIEGFFQLLQEQFSHRLACVAFF